MSLYELLERLCAITRLQADIILKQAEAIEQANIVYSVDEELRQMRTTAAAELEILGKEYN
jgi:hypothetical protein